MSAIDEVRAIMHRKRWNAFDLAKAAGVPPSTVTRVLKGSDPRTSTMDKIREAGRKRGK
jgi:predicted transcriptional regulator